MEKEYVYVRIDVAFVFLVKHHVTVTLANSTQYADMQKRRYRYLSAKSAIHV